jgi:D-alanyl-lipoteichoic acid acyltransferase DltB (MBOAT superfamily)
MRWVLSIMAVFALSGIWHGADLTFLCWGIWHGLLYLGEGGLIRLGLLNPVAGYGPAGWLRRGVVFGIVLVSWVFFRAASLHDVGIIFGRMLSGWNQPLYFGASQWTLLLSLGLIALLLLVQLIQFYGEGRETGCVLRNRPLRWACLIAMILGISVLGINSHAFIYFQF